jgi:hypothetical protein
MAKKCREEGCAKQPRFNYKENKSAIYCHLHKKDGMIDVVNYRCQEEGCGLIPAYNYEGNKRGLYCNSHKKDGMIHILAKRCQEEGCKIYAHFNYEGNKNGLYCITHKMENMIDVTSKRCNKEGCKLRGYYKNKNDSFLYCTKHKEDNMINARAILCKEHDCKITASYNYEGNTNVLYCNIHKKNGMINIKITKSTKCIESGCTKIPKYNYNRNTSPKYCNIHKKDGMINIRSKVCIEPGCITRPGFNYKGETSYLYCASHKKDGMIDIKNPQCKSEWCETHISTSKYDGYCLNCFIHLFPDKPNTCNYKTKEKATSDYILKQFPDLTWIVDKKVQDGCSRKRPDLFLDLGYQVIIIEVDENQHESYDCSCENKRLMLLSQDVGHRPIIFIRFNPDGYLTGDKKITSCWSLNGKGICTVKKSKKTEWNERLEALKDQIDYWIQSENKTEKTVEIIQLFYDCE